MPYTIHPLTEDSILIHFNQNDADLKVLQACNQIEKFPFKGFKELIPAYNTVTIYYDPMKISIQFPYQFVKSHIETILSTMDPTEARMKKYFKIPVCYDDEFALDLSELAVRNQISVSEAIDLHTKVIYDVRFIGFSPGFPFLAGLDTKLYCPRKTSPRLKVKRGSVGIAGHQTGIYSLDSPGGWQIIGRTPVHLFNVFNDRPTLLKAGDQVEFYPISRADFYRMEGKPWE